MVTGEVEMNKKQKTKLFDICRRSKRGLPVSEIDHRFASKMFEKYPDEYEKVFKAANEQAVKEFLGPFG